MRRLSWQKLRARLPALLPLGTKVAHKTGTGARNDNDAGIIFQGEEPLFILSVYTERVPVELPDGTTASPPPTTSSPASPARLGTR